MRLMLSMPLMVACIAGLAACGQNDEAFRASYRNQLMGACARGPARASTICTCMVDRYMRDTPIERLRAEKSQTEMPPAARQAMIQCATDAIRAGTLQPAVPAPVP